jgi:hypothetical protein
VQWLRLLTILQYTFGAPRVGNQKLADYIQIPEKKVGDNHRVTHYNDPVPRLPPSRWGYAHYTPELYIGAKNQKPVAISEMVLLNGSTASKGNEQFVVLDVDAHRWYFNSIAACYTANTPGSNKTENGTTSVPDLASSWAPSIVALMGNNSDITLVGEHAMNNALISALAGIIATMSTSAFKKFLTLVPGGILVQPFLPASGTIGVLASTGMAGLLLSLLGLGEAKL